MWVFMRVRQLHPCFLKNEIMNNNKAKYAASDLSYVGLDRCFFCNEGNEIVLDKRFHKTIPDDCGVISMHPCSKCKDLMKQGIIVITVRDGEEALVQDALREHQKRHVTDDDNRPFIPNPYRTGGWFVIRDHVFEVGQLVNNEEISKLILRRRWTFLEDAVAKAIGLQSASGEWLVAEQEYANEQTI